MTDRPSEGAGPAAPAAGLPADVVQYRSTPVFDEVSLPAGLRAEHSTKDGVWGLIRVVEGTLRYFIVDPRRLNQTVELTAQSDPGVVEPTIVHRVEPVGRVKFQVEFFRAA